LRDANLAEVDLRSADLRGAILAGTVLAEQEWFFNSDGTRKRVSSRATYDRHTRWPEGFDATRRGAQLVQ
jgi:uncharacterized protein YjbI with pentapeptide repeats